jgi:hypothetical protein
MDEIIFFRLRLLWVITAISSLILPVILPSSAAPGDPIHNVIGTATAAMFVLSFPGSIVGIPIVFLAEMVFAYDPNSISGMYINLLLLFGMGVLQWFWIMPKVIGQEEQHRPVHVTSALALTDACGPDFGKVPFREKSPVETIIDE